MFWLTFEMKDIKSDNVTDTDKINNETLTLETKL